MTARACISAIFIFSLFVAILRIDWVKLTSDLVREVKLACLAVLVTLLEGEATRVFLRVVISQLVHVIRDFVLTPAVVLLPLVADISHRRGTDFFDAQDFGCDSEPFFGHVVDDERYANWQKTGDKKQDEQQQGVLLLVSSRDGAVRGIENFGWGWDEVASLREDGIRAFNAESHNVAAATVNCGCDARSDHACGGQHFDVGVKEGHLMASPAGASSLASAALPSILEDNEEADLPVEKPAGRPTPKVEACCNMATMVLYSGAISALVAEHGVAVCAIATPDSAAAVSATRVTKRARRGGFMAPTASSKAVAAEGRSKKVDIVTKKQKFDAKRSRAIQKELAQLAASHKAMVKSLHVLRSEYSRAGTSREEVVAAMKTIGRVSSLERKISMSFI